MVIEKLPVVQVSVWAGISPENKKKIVEGITQVIHEVGGFLEKPSLLSCMRFRRPIGLQADSCIRKGSQIAKLTCCTGHQVPLLFLFAGSS